MNSNKPLSSTGSLPLAPNSNQSIESQNASNMSQDFIEMTATLPLATTTENGRGDSCSAPSPMIEATAALSGLVVGEEECGNDKEDGDETMKKQATQGTKKEKQQQSTLAHVIYLSAAAILGASLRVYLGRLFGGDCEDGNDDNAVPQDFLTPASKHICITSNGRSAQTGGALFRDLPANLVGSFVMGLVSTSTIKIPWLSRDHPLQRDDLYHLAISTGFCGSLTTFASWNTQMVVMMDGTMTELGSQVMVALFGYLFGFMLPISAFQFGQQVAGLLYTWKHSNNSGNITTTGDDEQVASDEHPKQNNCWDNHHPFKLLFVFASLVVTVLFAVVGYGISDIQFYQNMVLVLPLAPLGALTRWKLSRYNSPNNRTVCTKRFHWFPVGTWTANVVGATCSIACTVVLDRWTLEGADSNPWLNGLVFAMATGFGGSLSTVSSMVKEIVSLSKANPIRAYAYAIATFVSAMAISLIIYSSTIQME